MTWLETGLLLLGIFGLPIALLISSQRYRLLGRRMRGAFWGGAIGYAAGILIWGLATIAPAQMWIDGNARFAAVVFALALCGGAGFAIGALVGNEPRRPRHRRRGRAAPDAREHASSG